MPAWTAPFHLPEFTDETYVKAKAEHIAKVGFQITLPGLSDIIHIGQPNPMTDQEKDWYRKRQYWNFGKKRYDEIQEMKYKKKLRYDQMLASPIPAIVQNAASLLTAIDDAQDAISTMAWMGRILLHFAPRLLGRSFLGPVGWLLTAADIMSLVMILGGMGLILPEKKKKFHAATSSNPFTKKAKVWRAKRLRKWKPTFADSIQALQTTDQVFGVGISLGPIVGLIQDITFGTMRLMGGQPVRINKYPPPYKPWHRAAYKSMKAANIMNMVDWCQDPEIMMEVYAPLHTAHQVVQNMSALWNPLDVIDNLFDVEIQAPIPTDPLSWDVIKEAKTPIEEFTGWPVNGEQWVNINDIVDSSLEATPRNLKAIMAMNAHNWSGFAIGGLAAETAPFMLANIEDEEVVEYDYTAGSKIGGIMLESGLQFGEDMTGEERLAAEEYLEDAEFLGLDTSLIGVRNAIKERKIPYYEFDPTWAED